MSNSRPKNKTDHFDCKDIFFDKRYLKPAADVCSRLGVNKHLSKEPTVKVGVYNNGLWKVATYGENLSAIDDEYNQGYFIEKDTCEIPEAFFRHCKHVGKL